MSRDASLLVGTWKLLSTTRKDVESGEESPALGPHPTGFPNYSPDGRMMVVMVDGNLAPPSGSVPTEAEMIARFQGTLAYAGTYTVEGNQVTHHIEVSSDPLRAPDKLIRFINLDGRVLTLRAQPTRYWMGGGLSVVSIVWEKIG